jgi:hypothetical protein
LLPTIFICYARAIGRCGDLSVERTVRLVIFGPATSSVVIGRTIDRFVDNDSSAEERTMLRKRRLIKAPAEFRDLRDRAIQNTEIAVNRVLARAAPPGILPRIILN